MELIRLSFLSNDKHQQPLMSWNSENLYHEWHRFSLHVKSWWEGPLYNTTSTEKLGFLKVWIGDEGRLKFFNFRSDPINHLDDPYLILMKFQNFIFQDINLLKTVNYKPSKSIPTKKNSLCFEGARMNARPNEESNTHSGNILNDEVFSKKAGNFFNQTDFNICCLCTTCQDTKHLPVSSPSLPNSNSRSQGRIFENPDTLGSFNRTNTTMADGSHSLSSSTEREVETAQNILYDYDVDLREDNQETVAKTNQLYCASRNREIEKDGTELNEESFTGISLEETCCNKDLKKKHSDQIPTNTSDTVAASEAFCDNDGSQNIDAHGGSIRFSPYGQSAKLDELSCEEVPFNPEAIEYTPNESAARNCPAQTSASNTVVGACAASTDVNPCNPPPDPEAIEYTPNESAARNSPAQTSASNTVVGACAASTDVNPCNPPPDKTPPWETPKQITDTTLIKHLPKCIIDICQTELDGHLHCSIKDFMHKNDFNVGAIKRCSNWPLEKLLTEHPAFSKYTLGKLKDSLLELELEDLVTDIDNMIKEHNSKQNRRTSL